MSEDRTIADSMALLPVSLADAARALGCETQKGEIDYENIENMPWQEYLEKDCRATFEALEKLEGRVTDLGGNLRRTLAGTAMDLFRRKFLESPIFREKGIEKYERAALYGGRTELFCTHAQKVKSYDISSSYSYAALSAVPIRFIGEAKIRDKYDDTDIVEASVDVPEMDYPPLPCRYDGKLLFPAGKWRSWFVGVELRHAEQFGVRTQILRRLCYQSGPIFTRYVGALYAEKMAGNPAAKWLLNALYGRFAIRNDREKILVSPDEIKKGYRIINKELEIYGVADHTKIFACPAITATINARARIRLHEALIRSNGTAIYCDTDGIKLSSPRKDNEPVDKIVGVGEWKYEGESQEFEARAPKTYRLDDKIWAKGICLSLNNREKKDPGFALATWKSGSAEQWRMPGLIDQLKNSLPAKSKSIIKNIGCDLTKRIFDVNGKSTPIRINNI